MLKPKKILLLPRQSESRDAGRLARNLLNKTKRFAYSCVRKRRKFSEDARKPSGSHVLAWAAYPTSLSSGFLRPSNKEVVIQCHASFVVLLLGCWGAYK